MTLKDAVNETLREWTARIIDTHYVLGSVMGPHPFPTIVRDFQSVIGREVKSQLLEREGRLPDAVIACVGGGSNAIGIFHDFISDPEVRLIGCEAAGRGIDTQRTAATIATGSPGIFHGMKSYFCQDEFGQIAPVYSISAGLDYPGIGPEHAHLHDTGRARIRPGDGRRGGGSLRIPLPAGGVIPAVESAHAVACARKLAPALGKDRIIVVNLSGRGDRMWPLLPDTKGLRLVSSVESGVERECGWSVECGCGGGVWRVEWRVECGVMNRIEGDFKNNNKAFIPFITAGDPDLETTERLVLAMAEAGADLIELGIPFSDPVVEGVVIQRADERALSSGTTADRIFRTVERIRTKTDVPLAFMTYINPVYVYEPGGL